MKLRPGDTVVMKPSEQMAACTISGAEAFLAVGMDDSDSSDSFAARICKTAAATATDHTVSQPVTRDRAELCTKGTSSS